MADASLERWQSAVDLAALGRYDVADSALAALCSESGRWASLALSARASHRRQVGATLQAAQWDERALLLACDGVSRADALIGCAADAVAVGRGVQADVLLEEARSVAMADWRTRTRWRWVAAESSLLAGDLAAAGAHARAAQDDCRGISPRHEAKSAIIAVAAGGDIAGLAHVEAAVRSHGWKTLQWPLALVAKDRSGEVPADWLDAVWRAGCDAVLAIDGALPADCLPAWREHPGARRLRESRPTSGDG